MINNNINFYNNTDDYKKNYIKISVESIQNYFDTINLIFKTLFII